MPNGAALLDFGAHPGVQEASVDVTGQTGFIATSALEAYIAPAATADHSADEHRYEELRVDAVYVADGTLRIYGHSTVTQDRSQNGHNLYGKWNVGWVWVN